MNPPSGLLHRKNTSNGLFHTQSIAAHFAKKAVWPPRARRPRLRNCQSSPVNQLCKSNVHDLMLYARCLPALVGMIETFSWELHQICLQLSAAECKMFTTKPLARPTYVKVSQDLVHVFHEGSSRKYLRRHIPRNLGQRGGVELHYRKTIAWAKSNKHRTMLTNT